MAPRVVRGHHGTTVDAAEEMCAGHFKESDREASWLGSGVYFFEENFDLALDWANVKAQQSGKDPAIVFANIDLTHCLDLTTALAKHMLRGAHRDLSAHWEAHPSERREQKPLEIFANRIRAGYRGDWKGFGTNSLDYAVVERAIELAALQKNIVNFDTVRGVFIEEGPLYPNSWFFEGAHVAIAVRSPYSKLSDLRFSKLR